MDWDYSTRKPGRFSRIELRDILVSVVVLTLAFVLMFRDTSFVTTYFRHTMGDYGVVGMVLLMLALVMLSFIAHELAHKFTAQKLGLWSEYRMFPMGLLFAPIMGLVGFLFAAPGVVYISGFVDSEQDGKISVAGPMVNIVLSAVGIVGCIVCNGSPIVIMFYLLYTLNASLALFNLLPIGILDGAKVMRWDTTVWLISIIIAGLLFLSNFLGLLPQIYYQF
ncbi:MAG: Zn-dependent protease [archaeon]|nr:Zn-dependent protease [archaeon]